MAFDIVSYDRYNERIFVRSNSSNGTEITGAISDLLEDNLPVSKILVSSSGGKIVSSSRDSSYLAFLDPTSSIQTQLNGKEPTVTKGNLQEVTSSVLTITGGTGSVIGSGASIQVKQATAIQSGYLSSTNFADFNSRLSSSLANGRIIIGDGGGLAQPRAVTGDVLISNLGVTSIAAGVIVNADVNASAGIVYTKLASLTPDTIPVLGSTGFIESSGVSSGKITFISTLSSDAQTQLNNRLTVSLTSPAQGDIIKYNGTQWVNIARGTIGQVLTATSTDVAWVNPTSSGTVTSVAMTPPADGITITGSPITTSGTFVLTLADDLASVENVSTTGVVLRTAPNTWDTVANPAADTILAWDNTDGTVQYWTIGTGILYDHSTHTVSIGANVLYSGISNTPFTNDTDFDGGGFNLTLSNFNSINITAGGIMFTSSSSNVFTSTTANDFESVLNAFYDPLGGQSQIRLFHGDGVSNYISIKTPSLVASWTLTLPDTDGTPNQILSTDGAGVTSWITAGTVSSFSAGTLSPLFTTSVATATSTPALTFVLTNAGAHTYFGNATGSSGAPSYTSAGSLTKVDDTNVTLTLGGAPTTSLLQSASLTLGWTGRLALTRFVQASAASVILGRGSAGGAGDYQELTLGTNLSLTGTVLSSSNGITPSALTKVDDTNVTLTLGGTPATALLQAASLTLGWTGRLALTRFVQASAASVLLGRGSAGGAGDYQEVTLGSGLSMTGTVLSSTGGVTPAALTKVDDTNVTLTLGGTPATALLQASSLTLGWTGTLAATRGGTGTGSYTVGDVLYASTTTALSKLAAGAAGTILMYNGAGAAPIVSTLVLPNAATSSRVVYATATNTYGESANMTFSGSTLAITGGITTTTGVANTTNGGTNNAFTATRSGNLSGSGVVLGLSVTGVFNMRATASDVAYVNRTNTNITTASTTQVINNDYYDPAIVVNNTGAILRGFYWNPTLSGTQVATLTHYGLTIGSGTSIFGGITPTAGSVLVDFQSTTLGILMPRVTNIASVATPVAGMIAYDAATNRFNFRENASWLQLGGIGGSTGATDNRILRSDGTGGSTLQNSLLGIDDSGNLIDSNVNELVKFTATSSAVNEVTIINAATGGEVIIQATGDDANIPLSLKGKGTRGVSIYGFTDGSSAASGQVGEEVIATQSSYTNYTTTATYQNITSITLTAGDWDISAFFTLSVNSSTLAGNGIFVISTTTASAAGATEGKNISYFAQTSLSVLGSAVGSGAISPYRVSISGSTTYYLNSQASFSAGNPQFVGGIRARRIR